MRSTIFVVLLAATSALAANPVPSEKLARDAVALSKAIYTPEMHARQMEATTNATMAQFGNMPGIKVDADKFKAAMTRILDYQWMVDLQASMFAKYYSSEELAELLKFYQSPVGKKALSIMPQVTQDVMGQSMEKTRSPAAVKMLQEAITIEMPDGGRTRPGR